MASNIRLCSLAAELGSQGDHLRVALPCSTVRMAVAIRIVVHRYVFHSSAGDNRRSSRLYRLVPLLPGRVPEQAASYRTLQFTRVCGSSARGSCQQGLSGSASTTR